MRGMWRGVKEAVAVIVGLKALSWTHETRNAVDRRGTGKRRGQPGVQREGVGHWTHAGVNWCWAIEGQHW